MIKKAGGNKTLEWYAEVDGIATMVEVEERAMSARKKRDQTECQIIYVLLQRQLTQQTLTGSTHKKKKISSLRSEGTNKTATPWKTQYINSNGQVTPLPPGGGGGGGGGGS